MKDQAQEYRDHLLLAEKDAQQDFDKTVFALSGGAIGVSFAFVSDIVDPQAMVSVKNLIWAWGSWAGSLLCVLFSYYFSHLALRKTINQVDEGKLNQEHRGGFSDYAIALLNPAGALLFVAGLVLMIIFVNLNLGA